MLFNSFSFLGFFAVLVVVYYASPHRYRWGLLLLASLYSYAAFKPQYVLLLLGVTTVGYVAGRAIERSATTGARRAWLIAAVSLVLGTLFVNKYYDFFVASLNRAIDGAGASRLDMAVAAGLSFYAFSCVSYLVDVYRGTLPAEPHVGRFALYIAFFPKLLAGPIERAKPFLAQLERPVRFDSARVTAGLQLMLWGLFKKVVIADRLAPVVDAAYKAPSFANPADLVIATYFFAFQLYCDFSGYSDIAIGTARGARLRPDGELPPAVSVQGRAGVLGAALAPVAVVMVPRLLLLPARRQPRGPRAGVREPDDRVPRQRSVARSQLDVRRLGRTERLLSGRRERDGSQPQGQ